MAPTLYPPHRRSSNPPIVATSNDGVLPLDLLYDMLLRLPTEPICRFRAVCRSWRSTLCHPDFIAAARNPGPLHAAAVSESFSLNSSSWFFESKILDIENGDEVKRVLGRSSYYRSLDSMSHEDVVCVASKDQRIALLDPVTGATCILPDHQPLPDASTGCIIGRAASTGKHKVLAVATAPTMASQVCKVLTLGGGDDLWRETGSPPLNVVTSCKGVVVVNGVAYMLEYLDKSACPTHQMIMEFDLDCEEWRPASLRGPINLVRLSLAELQDQLVAGYDDRRTAIELWFLVDSERSIWSKQYTITMPQHQTLDRKEYLQKPLAVLEDVRIVMWMRVDEPRYNIAFLWIYDPRTQIFSDGTIVLYCNCVTVFTWSLLHSGRGALDRVARIAVISKRHH